jgi:translocation and assembly module TamB
VNGYVIRTSGSVGLDGSLQIVADLPVPAKAVERALAKAPRLRDALAKQTLKVPIGGTVSQPKLDARALDAAADQVVQALLKNVADDLLNKGADKLRDELLKKLGGKK